MVVILFGELWLTLGMMRGAERAADFAVLRLGMLTLKKLVRVLLPIQISEVRSPGVGLVHVTLLPLAAIVQHIPNCMFSESKTF